MSKDNKDNKERIQKTFQGELILDPTTTTDPKKQNSKDMSSAKNNISKITPPYQHEREAIRAASVECDVGGPQVWIMTSTPEPLRTIFTAIRTCYSPYDQAYIGYEEYFKYLNKPSSNPDFPNDMVRLLAQIARMQHLSTLEHVSFTFGLRCVSRATLSQLTRHRVGWSYSVQSQRYVKQSTESRHGVFDFIVPPSLKETECTEKYVDAMISIQDTYDELIKCGVKAEDARYILPNAATTNITVTANLRAFLDFYSKRNCETHSQWEISMLAERMKCELLKLEPGLEFLFHETNCEC